MRFKLHLSAAAVAAATALLALASPAGAARPVKGVYFNGSTGHGAYLQTTRHTIKTMSLYCRDPRWVGNGVKMPYRESRYDIYSFVHVSRNGSFSFSGKVARFGAEGQPLGRWKIRLSGRFVSRSRVEIRRKANGCKGGSHASARLQR